MSEGLLDENEFDVVVVGSGASGGVAAYELSRGGLKVLLLEAGRDADPGRDIEERPFWVRDRPHENPRSPIQSKCFSYDGRSQHLFVDDTDQPYSYPKDAPFHWIRSRIMGGRTLLWGKVCFRMSPMDFKPSRFGLPGEDWPLSYDELAPFYDRVESLLGVTRSADGLGAVPDGGVGEVPMSGPMAQRFASVFAEAFPDRRLIRCRLAEGRRVSADESHPYGFFPESTSLRSFLLAAIKTGNLLVRSGAVAARVLTDERSGRAFGVECVDDATGERFVVRGKQIVLCASAIESIRLLWNSRSDLHPHGLGNSGGALGAYFMDHLTHEMMGELPERISAEKAVGERLYVPEGELGARLGYAAMIMLIHDPKFSHDIAVMKLFGEVSPRRENRVTIDESRRDCWGIPVPHLRLAYSKKELETYAEARQFFGSLARKVGIKIWEHPETELVPGSSIHELGGARMGTDPRSSVLNSRHQVWGVDNLYVLDGASFVTSATQNPTLTIMALAARASEFIAQDARDGLV